jgi:hypothetical protein
MNELIQLVEQDVKAIHTYGFEMKDKIEKSSSYTALRPRINEPSHDLCKKSGYK